MSLNLVSERAVNQTKLFHLDETDDDEDMPQRSRRRRIAERAAEGDMDMQEDMIESIENLEDMKGHSVREWVCLQPPRLEIKNRFKQFLKTFVDDQGKSVYREKIKAMCEGKVCWIILNLHTVLLPVLKYHIILYIFLANLQSLAIDYNVLACEQHLQVLAYFLPEAPAEMLKIFDEVQYSLALYSVPRVQLTKLYFSHIRIIL